MQVLPAAGEAGSDLEWKSLGNWLLLSLKGAFQGQQAA